MPKLYPIVGHTSQLQELQRDFDIENIAHAYLFEGKKNLGKIAVAYDFAQKLLCIDCTDDDDCERCRKQIENLTHPDLLVLDQLWIDKVCDDWDVISRKSNAPQEHRSKKASPAKTDTISIDDVRALQKRLYETGLGRYRCCIIRGMERMQDAAANAFLKILEEPPKGLIFILTTSSIQSLLPTIISRTRILHFHPLSRKELLPLLNGISEADQQFILRMAQGAPGAVRSLAEDPDRLRAQKQVAQLAKSFWHAHSLKQRLEYLAPLLKRGEESDTLLFHLSLALRKEGHQKQTADANHLISLMRDLDANVQRGLAVQRFALAVS